MGRGIGSSDGFLYMLDPSADPDAEEYPLNALLEVQRFGTPLGDLSAADLDQDGWSEVVVPTQDGTVWVLDEPGLAVRCRHVRDNGNDIGAGLP